MLLKLQNSSVIKKNCEKQVNRSIKPEHNHLHKIMSLMERDKEVLIITQLTEYLHWGWDDLELHHHSQR